VNHACHRKIPGAFCDGIVIAAGAALSDHKKTPASRGFLVDEIKIAYNAIE